MLLFAPPVVRLRNTAFVKANGLVYTVLAPLNDFRVEHRHVRGGHGVGFLSPRGGQLVYYTSLN